MVDWAPCPRLKRRPVLYLAQLFPCPCSGSGASLCPGNRKSLLGPLCALPSGLRGLPNLISGEKGLRFIGLLKNFFLMSLRDRERQSVSRRGVEREGDTESEAGSRLWAVSMEPDTGLELVNCEIMTWAEVWRLNYWATQATLTGPF